MSPEEIYEYLKKPIVLICSFAVLLAAIYVFCDGTTNGGTTAGFGDTKRELRAVGQSLGDVNARVGRSEAVASSIGNGIDRVDTRAEQLGGNLHRATSGAGEVKGGIREAEKRIVFAQSLIRQSLNRTARSREIIERYRKQVSEREEKAPQTK